ncbi:response regulator [Bdellovibrionota bacterium]
MIETRFLIVDDEEAIRELNARFLKGLDPSEIDEASNGEEAIQAVRQKPYRLVFMDLKMPKVDGFKAIHQIKRDRPDQEILILTSMNLAPQTLELLRYPGVDLLKKPYQKEHFLNKVKEVLGNTKKSDIPMPTYRHPVSLKGTLDNEQVTVTQLGPAAAVVTGKMKDNYGTLKVQLPKQAKILKLNSVVQLYDSNHVHLSFKDLSPETKQTLEEFVLNALEESQKQKS